LNILLLYVIQKYLNFFILSDLSELSDLWMHKNPLSWFSLPLFKNVKDLFSGTKNSFILRYLVSLEQEQEQR